MPRELNTEWFRLSQKIILTEGCTRDSLINAVKNVRHPSGIGRIVASWENACDKCSEGQTVRTVSLRVPSAFSRQERFRGREAPLSRSTGSDIMNLQ